MTIAVNAIYELEYVPLIEAEQIKWTKENTADFDLGLAWLFSPKFAVTLKNTFRNVFAEGQLEHSALYTGPGLSWVQNNFWLNFTVLPQVASFKGQSGNALNLNEFEMIQFRLIFSFIL